jgi:hypothetical protein
MVEEITPDDPVVIVEEVTFENQISNVAYEDTQGLLDELFQDQGFLRKIDNTMITAFGALSKAEVKQLRNAGTGDHRLSYFIENEASLFNYVVNFNGKGKAHAFIVEYENQGSWDDESFSTFTGYIRYYDAQGKLRVEHEMLNGQPKSKANARTCYAETYYYGWTEVSSPAGVTYKDFWMEPKTSIVPCDADSPTIEVPLDQVLGGGGGVPLNLNDTPDERRRKQLNYIRLYGGPDGKEFVEAVEEYLRTSGLTMGDVGDKNLEVEKYYRYLKGVYLIIPFHTVSIAAKPFIELVLLETGSAVAVSAATKILRTKWSLDLVKLGKNELRPAQAIRRIENLIQPVSGNRIRINANGKTFTSLTGHSGTFEFMNITKAEAQGIFNDFAIGRTVNKISNSKGWEMRSVLVESNGSKLTMTIRHNSTSVGGHTTIDFKLTGQPRMEFKFKNK